MSGRQALRRLLQQGLQAARGHPSNRYALQAGLGSTAPRGLGIGSKAVLPQHRSILLQHGRDAHRAFFTTSMRAAAESAGKAASSQGAAGMAGKQLQQRVRAVAWGAVAFVRTVLGGVRAVGRQGGRALEVAGTTPVGKAAQMQIASLWQAHGGKITLVTGAVLVYLLYRVSFATASTFVNFSHNMAGYGFLALAVALVLFGYQYLVARYTLNPNRVYQLAMLQLNSNPGVLEVMGAPLHGSDVRAYVVTGRRLYWKGLRPKVATHHMQIMFPLEGPKKRGLASIEAKKKQGKVKFKLLAVDLPAANGEPAGRLYLVGNDAVYQKGSVLAELRDPFLKAMSLQDAYQEEDEQEAEAEEQAAEREHLQQQQEGPEDAQQQQQEEQQQKQEQEQGQQRRQAAQAGYQQQQQPQQQEREQHQQRHQQATDAATLFSFGDPRPAAGPVMPADHHSLHVHPDMPPDQLARRASRKAAGAIAQTERSDAVKASMSTGPPEPAAAAEAGASSSQPQGPAEPGPHTASDGDTAAPTPAPSAVAASVEKPAPQPSARTAGWRQWLYGSHA